MLDIQFYYKKKNENQSASEINLFRVYQLHNMASIPSDKSLPKPPDSLVIVFDVTELDPLDPLHKDFVEFCLNVELTAQFLSQGLDPTDYSLSDPRLKNLKSADIPSIFFFSLFKSVSCFQNAAKWISLQELQALDNVVLIVYRNPTAGRDTPASDFEFQDTPKVNGLIIHVNDYKTPSVDKLKTLLKSSDPEQISSSDLHWSGKYATDQPDYGPIRKQLFDIFFKE